MSQANVTSAADVEVVVRGKVRGGVRDHAERMVADLERYAQGPILHARVRLTASADPAQARPVIAQANIDVNGRLVRAQVSGRTADESIDLLFDVLKHRLPEFARHWQARRGAMPSNEPHEWRHSSLPTRRPDFFPRPPEQREVIRRKVFELARVTPDEAIEDLEVMDYRFQLFTDLETGQDSVVYRVGPTGFGMSTLAPDLGRRWKTAVPLTLNPQPAPRLGLAQAIDRLNITSLPFLFFADETTGRGNVLYRRYDGHYGLITPAS